MQFNPSRLLLIFCALYLGFFHIAHAQNLTFQPIFFDAESSKLTKPAKEGLNRVAELLKSNAAAKLTLEGHSGQESTTTDLQKLSEDRAIASQAYLAGLGVAKDRLDTIGRGSSRLQRPDQPTSPENRRVEFVFHVAQTSDSSKKGLEEIDVLYWNTLYHCLYQIGVDRGLFEGQGFKVTLVATNHSINNQVKATCGIEPFLKNTAIFTGAVCGGSPHEAIAKGVPLVVIGGMLAGGSMLIAKPELGAKLRADWKNFKGITIGRPKGTVLTSMIVAYNISKHGLDPKKDIKWMEFDSHEEVLDAIASGKVDAGDSYAPLNLTAKKKYGLMEVYNTVELFPYHPCCRVITTRVKLDANREKYVRFMKGLIKSHEYFIKQPVKAMEIVQKYTGYTMEEVKLSLTNPNFLLSPDPLKNGFVKFWNMMKETGYIKSDKDINKYIDTTVYEDALKSLQAAEPKNPYYAYMMKQFKEQNL